MKSGKHPTQQEKHLLKVLGSQAALDAAVKEMLDEEKVWTRRAAIVNLYKANSQETVGDEKLTGFYLGEFDTLFGGKQSAFYLLTKKGVQEVRIASMEMHFPQEVPKLALVEVPGVTLVRDLERGDNYQYYSWAESPVKRLPMDKVLFLEAVQTTNDVGYTVDSQNNRVLLKNNGHFFIETTISRIEQIKEDYDKESKKWLKELPFFTDEGVNMRLHLTGEGDKAALVKCKVPNRGILIQVYGEDAPPNTQKFLDHLEEAETEDQYRELVALEGKTIYMFAQGSKMVKGEEIQNPWMSMTQQGWVMDEDEILKHIQLLVDNPVNAVPAPAPTPSVPVEVVAQDVGPKGEADQPADEGPDLDALLGAAEPPQPEAPPQPEKSPRESLLDAISAKAEAGGATTKDFEALGNALGFAKDDLASLIIETMGAGLIRKEQKETGTFWFVVSS